MKTSLRSTLAIACAAAMACAGLAHAQSGSAPARRGITDIMRSGPAVVPPAAPRPAPVQRGQRIAEYIVALVNSEPITNTEVQKRLDRVLDEAGPEAQRMPREVLARQVLEQLISERAQLQLAKELGVKADDAAVDQGVEIVARQNQVSVAELQRRIAQAGISREEFRGNIRNQIILTRLRERELESRTKVSDGEIAQYLAAQQSGAAGAQDINIAQVLVAVPENAGAAQVAQLQRRAEDIAQRARAGQDFAALVTEYSDAPDKSAGGALGLRSAERYPPLFVEGTQSTPVGGIAGPVRSPAGFHVLKVLARERGAAADAVVRQTQLRHILIRPDAKRTPEEAVALLQDYKRRIQGGTADFAALARDHSQDPGSAKNGGELGWSVPGQFVPEFEEAMDRLQPGQISDPVVTRFGVHLIQVEGRREAKLKPEELREVARNTLRDKKMEEAYEAWSQEVRARAYVELREPPQI
ncbi:peptidylprolyl isomerase [Xenophilus sp.]|uniref:peptidylprolyl isomerase n=2 Tax=Xenophilus sp. TaxID=1873499 RepID=UPI0037DD8139